MNYWRRNARVVCDAVRAEWRQLPEDEQTEERLRSMLRDAYPFGERAMWPYTMWLQEQRAALGAEGYVSARQVAARAAQVAATGQMTLFAAAEAPVAVLEPPAADPWGQAFAELKSWKSQPWADGDEDGDV